MGQYLKVELTLSNGTLFSLLASFDEKDVQVLRDHAIIHVAVFADPPPPKRELLQSRCVEF